MDAELASKLRLFTLAAVTLFLELALIRWCSANVLYLGYFSNFVLLACFLGIGVGFLLARRSWDLFPHTLTVLFAVLVFVYLFEVQIALPDASERVYFGFDTLEAPWIPPWLILSTLFAGTTAVFAALCQETGRCFARFRPLVAYNLDIAGSIAGIALFTALSALYVPAWVWFGLAAATIVGLQWPGLEGSDRRVALLSAAGCVAIVVLSQFSVPGERVTWSPYQMVSVAQIGESADQYALSVNRIPHQNIRPASDDYPEYHVPYEIAESYGDGRIERALIIGSGAGRDVAYALKHDVEQIDAVEIDPAIAAYGRRLHPDRPYDDPRVDLIVDDGRNVLETTDKAYDLIVFALPDSLALLSSYSSVRLESFLFTRESFEAARRALAPDGALVMYNYYRTDRLVRRMATTLHRVFGRWPSIRRVGGGGGMSVLAVGRSEAGPGARSVDFEPAETIPTDDWPFLYMNEPSIPMHYVVPMAAILLFSFLLVGGATPAGSLRGYHATFFFMGAAFLLLETKSVVQFSLLFGATWLTNSLVFAGVLAMVLVANLVVMWRKPSRVWPWYVVLAGSLFLGWYVELSALAGLQPTWLRYGTAVLLVFSPIFVANLIFSATFVDAEDSDVSFGWNLMGAMVGGTFEYASLALGYRNLAVVVAVFYALAFGAYWFGWRRRQNGASSR